MENITVKQNYHRIQPIAKIHSCYAEKFGIPRQPGLVTKAIATIEMLPPFARAEFIKGLDAFSHIWILFLFSDVMAEGWKTTVRPPGLGGQQRVGVFASRSPHRPNHIGISAVKLNAIKHDEKSLLLEVEGGDFLDGTPVVDIKPYVPFADMLPIAVSGYSARGISGMEVRLVETVVSFCRDYSKRTGRDLAGLIEQVLHQDPRPASQRQKKESFGMQLWDVNIKWRVKGNRFEVFKCEQIRNHRNL